MKASLVFLFLALFNSAFAARIEFDSLPNGQIRATGSDFNRSATGNRQVNFYKNGQFLNQINLNSNGSFSYTAPKHTFNHQDRMTVKVLQYVSHNQHYERTGTYYYTGGGNGNGYHSLEIKSLARGQMQVVGRNFTRSHSNNDQVNFYKNGKYFAEIRMNSNGSFSYTSPEHTFRRGDELTVKVLQYLGNGHHFEQSEFYRQQDDDDQDNDYVIACYRNLATYANQSLCVELRVPARISAACGSFPGTIANEAVCLRSRTNPETTKACSEYMSTVANEAACLRTKNLSPAIIRDCSRYSSTQAQELRCIQNAG